MVQVRLVISFLILQTILWSLPSQAADAQLMRTQLQLEAELSSQVKKELLQIFKKDEFIISSSIKLKSYKVTKVLEKESNINKRPQVSRDQEILPGFYEPFKNEGGVFNEQVRKVYGYETRTEIQKAEMRILVDENVSDIKLEAAKKLVTLRLNNSFDGKMTVQFISTILKPTLTPVPFWQEFSGYLRENLSLLLTFFFAITFLFILASLIGRVRSKDPPPPQVWPFPPPFYQGQDPMGPYGGHPFFPGSAQKHHLEGGQKPLHLPQKEKEIDNMEINKKINKFVGSICKEPFVTRKFFQTLEKEEQTKFIGLFSTKSSRVALGEFFGEDLLNIDITDVTSIEDDLDPEEKLEFLEHISLEHDRFKNLMAIKNGQRFSILSLMNDKELEYVFSNESPKNVSYLLHFLPRNSISTVLNKMNNSQKTEIILNLKKSSSFTNVEEKEIEERLNRKINTFASSAFSTFMSEDSLVGSILDDSDNVQEILSQISNEDKGLAKDFEEHSLNLDYFIKNQLKNLSKIFEPIPNEILAMALINLDKNQQSRVLNALSPMRKKVIASSMLMKSKVSEEEIKKAKLQTSKLARKAYLLLKRNKMNKTS